MPQEYYGSLELSEVFYVPVEKRPPQYNELNSETKKAFDNLRQAIDSKQSIDAIEVLITALTTLGGTIVLDVGYTHSYGLRSTLLMQVTQANRSDITEALLKSGANLQIGSDSGTGALNVITEAYQRRQKDTVAFTKHEKELIYLMVESNPHILTGCYIDRSGPQNTPLHDVIALKDWGLVKYFIEKDAPLDVVNGFDFQSPRQQLEALGNDCPENIRALITDQKPSLSR